MATQTYTSLLADCLLYSERVDDAVLLSQLPTLVMLAENRVATDMKTEGSELVVTGVLTSNSPVLDKPTYWRDTVSLQLTRPSDGTRFNVLPRAYEYCVGFWPDREQVREPRFYADYDFDHFFLAPTPDAAYEFELKYHARRDPLSPAHQTNWMTLNAPQLLFYATMLEVSTFLKNDDKITVWGNLYRDSIMGLSKEDSGRRSDATTVPK